MSERQSEKSPLILIVDDDRTMRSLLNLAMEEEGYRVIEAANGEQCLSEYSHFQPDLILLDAVMPDIDGFTCCRKIRRMPGGDRLPILMITVLDDRDSVDRAFDAGATDYITKPIYWSVLSQRVRRLLDNGRVWAELRQQRAWENLVRTILGQLAWGNLSSDSLQQILRAIREWLQGSRILLYQSDSETYLESVVEGTAFGENFLVTDFNLIAQYGEQYQQGTTVVIEDISQTKLPSALIEQLQQLNTRAVSIVPIQKGERVLGSLLIHFSGVLPQNRELLSKRLLDLGKLLAIGIP